MTKAEKNRLLHWNSMIWLAAMALPFFLNLTLGGNEVPLADCATLSDSNAG